jgi:hypothetical protein
MDSDISEREEEESEISLTLQHTIEKEKESLKSSLCSEQRVLNQIQALNNEMSRTL